MIYEDIVRGIILWTFILIIYLIINYFISREFYRIACMKGYSNEKYLWLPFFFGIIGYLLVIALPVLNSDVKKNIEKMEHEDKIPACGRCGNIVGEDDKECSNCGAKFE